MKNMTLLAVSTAPNEDIATNISKILLENRVTACEIGRAHV